MEVEMSERSWSFEQTAKFWCIWMEQTILCRSNAPKRSNRSPKTGNCGCTKCERFGVGSGRFVEVSVTKLSSVIEGGKFQMCQQTAKFWSSWVSPTILSVAIKWFNASNPQLRRESSTSSRNFDFSQVQVSRRSWRFAVKLRTGTKVEDPRSNFKLCAKTNLAESPECNAQ